jgi:hypothetical protein
MVIAATMLGVPAAAIAANDPAPLPRPDALQQPVTDGCQRSPAGLLTFSSPEWVYVRGHDSNNPDPAKARLAEGVAHFSDTATGDLPQNHGYYDFNTDVVVDGGFDGPYGYLLGGDPATHNGNFADTPTVLHVEWESGTLPPFDWPTAGDHLKLWGSWVWDCGHWGTGFTADPSDPGGSAIADTDYFLPGTNQTGGLRGEQTEFHPMQAVVVTRDNPYLPQVDETETDAFMSSAGTIAHSEGLCSLQHPAPSPSTEGPDWTACVQNPASERQPVNDRDYSFFVPAPPKPSPNATLRYRVVAHPIVGRGPQEQIQVKPDGIEVTVPFKGFGNNTEPLAFSKSFFVGWDAPVQNLAAHAQVIFKQLTIHHSLDDPNGFDTSAGVPPGEWELYSNINGGWTLLDSYKSQLQGVNSGDVLNLNHTYDLNVAAGKPVHVSMDGRECDLPRIQPCPATSEVAEDNDSPGDASNDFATLSDAIGQHTLKPPGADPNWELSYEVKQITPASTGPTSGPNCIDTVPPASRISHLGIVATHSRLTLHGGAHDPDCIQALTVRRVLLSVERRGGGLCRHLLHGGGLSQPRSCRERRFLLADGGKRWSFDRAVNLPPGRYLAASRAIDTSGNVEYLPSQTNRLGFKVK